MAHWTIRVRLATSIWYGTLMKNCFKDWSRFNHFSLKELLKFHFQMATVLSDTLVKCWNLWQHGHVVAASAFFTMEFYKEILEKCSSMEHQPHQLAQLQIAGLSCTHSRGQIYINIALVLQDMWLTIFTHPANTCTCPLKAYAIKNVSE